MSMPENFSRGRHKKNCITFRRSKSGATTGARNDYNTSCGGNGPESIFFLDLDPGYKLTIGQTSNNYDSRHQLAYGGSCPGINTVNCIDDPDTEAISWENRLDTAERVYFMIDNRYSSGHGDFTIAWNFHEDSLIPYKYQKVYLVPHQLELIL